MGKPQHTSSGPMSGWLLHWKEEKIEGHRVGVGALKPSFPSG